MKQVDVLIIGGGPAGLAAAIAAHNAGCRNVLILERDAQLGGSTSASTTASGSTPSRRS